MIFYFSATGNSKYVATRLEEKFNDKSIKIDDALRHEEFEYEAAKGERIFLVCPTYYFNLPNLVSDFLEKITFKGEPADFVCVATCGSSIGGLDRIIKNKLKGKNLNFKAVYPVRMIDNYVVFFKMPLPEEETMKQRRAEEELDNVIDNILFNYRVPYTSNIWQGILSGFGGLLYRKLNKTKAFKVDEKKCIKCGLCQFHCPARAITMKGHPVWIKDHCTHCMACIQRCPAHCIDYGEKTKDRGRYVHPILK